MGILHNHTDNVSKEPGSNEWIVGPKVKAKKFPDGEVTGLEPGKKYEFRVRAENKAGLGEPSESTNPHLMKVSVRSLI